MKDLSAIRDSINELSFDIKAEAVLADLMEDGLSLQDWIIIPDGTFRRRFRKDVSHAELIGWNNGQRVVGIHLTREGLYDALPEAIFHGPADPNLNTGHEMARASKQQKMEEKESRSFFLPFENEIFIQRTQLEIIERKILQKFSENLFNDIFPDFWNLDRSLPRDLVSKLMLFLHYAWKIAGDPGLTASALEVILDEPVSVRILPEADEGLILAERSVDAQTLGSQSLGYDMICGDPPASLPGMEFTIGPLRNTRMEDYLQNGSHARLIEAFFSYFVPFDRVPSYRISGPPAGQAFVLNGTEPVYLGFNTVLMGSFH